MKTSMYMCREDTYAALAEYTARMACDELVFKEVIDAYDVRNFVEEILITTFKNGKAQSFYLPVLEIIDYKKVHELMDIAGNAFKGALILAIKMNIVGGKDESNRVRKETNK